MKASRQFQVKEESTYESLPRTIIAVVRSTSSSKDAAGATADDIAQLGSPPATTMNNGDVSEKHPIQQPSPPATPSADPDLHIEPKRRVEINKGPADDSSTVGAEDNPTADPAPRDPLQWFGILVPRELRSAQTSFSAAIGDTVSTASNAARGMREVEAEIRRVRKAIRKAEKAGSG